VSKRIFKRFHGDLELEIMDFGCLLRKSKSGFLNLKKPKIKSDPKGLEDEFYGCKKVEKTFWFCDRFIF